jgi:hypothetical protein
MVEREKEGRRGYKRDTGKEERNYSACHLW